MRSKMCKVCKQVNVKALLETTGSPKQQGENKILQIENITEHTMMKQTVQ